MSTVSVLFYLLIFTGIVYGIILSVALWIRRAENNGSNRILAVLVLFCAIQIAVDFLYHSQLIYYVPMLINTETLLAMLSNYLLYLFIHKRVRPGIKLSNQILILSILLAILVFFLSYYLEPTDSLFYSSYSEWILPPYPTEYFIFWAVSVVFGITMTLLALAMLFQYNRRVKGFATLSDNFRSDRIFMAITGIGVILFTDFCLYSAAQLRLIENIESFVFSDLVAVCLTYMIAFKVYNEKKPNDEKSKPAMVEEKPVKSAAVEQAIEKTIIELPDEEARKYMEQLDQLMLKDKLYAESSLKIKDLADRLNLTTHFLSGLLNAKLNRNFFDFVNSYRVEEAKRLLRSPEFSHYSVLGIGYEVGFGSKSTYYTVFKNHTNMTPSQFQKQPIHEDED